MRYALINLNAPELVNQLCALLPDCSAVSGAASLSGVNSVIVAFTLASGSVPAQLLDLLPGLAQCGTRVYAVAVNLGYNSRFCDSAIIPLDFLADFRGGLYLGGGLLLTKPSRLFAGYAANGLEQLAAQISAGKAGAIHADPEIKPALYRRLAAAEYKRLSKLSESRALL